ncbi:MAG: GntR family transcriptional regulator [Verrucomicrobiota bacterium]
MMTDVQPPTSFLTKSRQTFLELRSQILEGRILPGTRLTLRPVAKQLGVGMNVVGEALRALEHEGLVEVEPRVGARVRSRDLAAIRAEFILRLALECEAARQCAARLEVGSLRALEKLAKRVDALVAQGGDLESARQADVDFHLAVARLSEVPPLEAALAPLLPRLVVLDQAVNPAQEFPAASHERLVHAMQEGETAAAEAMREHILDAMHWALGAGF